MERGENTQMGYAEMPGEKKDIPETTININVEKIKRAQSELLKMQVTRDPDTGMPDARVVERLLTQLGLNENEREEFWNREEAGGRRVVETLKRLNEIDKVKKEELEVPKQVERARENIRRIPETYVQHPPSTEKIPGLDDLTGEFPILRPEEIDKASRNEPKKKSFFGRLKKLFR